MNKVSRFTANQFKETWDAMTDPKQMSQGIQIILILTSIILLLPLLLPIVIIQHLRTTP